MSACSREHHENILTCPCQSGCPNGCPCDVYVCPTIKPSTTTATVTSTDTTTTAFLNVTDILVLSTFSSVSIPVLTDSSGKVKQDVDFFLGITDEVFNSCTLTWKGQHFIIGGERRRTQISKIVDCGLKKVGDLQFSHASVACTNVADNFIYLCFNGSVGDWKRCRKSTGPLAKFAEIDLSLYPHKSTYIASSTSNLNLCYLNKLNI